MTRNAAGHVELPIPNGWFAVAWSKDFVAGEVKRAYHARSRNFHPDANRHRHTDASSTFYRVYAQADLSR